MHLILISTIIRLIIILDQSFTALKFGMALEKIIGGQFFILNLHIGRRNLMKLTCPADFLVSRCIKSLGPNFCTHLKVKKLAFSKTPAGIHQMKPRGQQSLIRKRESFFQK